MKTFAISALVVLNCLLQLSIIEACTCVSPYLNCPPYLSYISVVNVTYDGPVKDEGNEMDPWFYQFLRRYIYQAEVHNIYDGFGHEVNVTFATKFFTTPVSSSLCGSSLVVGQDYLLSDKDISSNSSGFGNCSLIIHAPSKFVAVIRKNNFYSICGDQVVWLKKRNKPDNARSVSNIQDKSQQKNGEFKKWLGKEE